MSVPLRCVTTTVSLSATRLFVTVKVCHVVVPAAETRVMTPFDLLSVTPVVLDVVCVTVPPEFDE